MSLKFNRDYRILIELTDGTALDIKPPFTIDFTIQRQTLSTANSLDLNILNLNPAIRRQLFQDRYLIEGFNKIVVQAGYNNELSTVYVGNIYEAQSQSRGGDTEVITQIKSRDGFLDVALTQSNRTFNSNTSAKEIINALINDLPNVKKGGVGGFDKVYKRPVTVEGNSYENIKKYSNNNTFIDNNKIYALDQSEILPGSAYVLDESTGLLETPVKQETLLRLKTLFAPQLNVGRIANVKSRIEPIFNGQYKIIGLTHSGTISEGVGQNDLTTDVTMFIGGRRFGEFKPIEVN